MNNLHLLGYVASDNSRWRIRHHILSGAWDFNSRDRRNAGIASSEADCINKIEAIVQASRSQTNHPLN